MKNDERLELPEYYAEFDQHFWIPGNEFWKFERGQHYVEPSSDSWNAFNRGDWDTALAIMNDEYDQLTDIMQRQRNHNVETRRVRIVEHPLTPYLQWELHFLRQRNQAGGPIRVLHADTIAPWEHNGQLPDLNTISPQLMYKVIYDANGAIEHAIRYTDLNTITAAARFTHALYTIAEPIERYFQREVAPLPAPKPENPLQEGYLDKVGRPRQPRS